MPFEVCKKKEGNASLQFLKAATLCSHWSYNMTYKQMQLL